MLIKKILNIFGLLFAGGALATEISLPGCATVKGSLFNPNDCTHSTDNDTPPVTFCILNRIISQENISIKTIFSVTNANTDNFACNLLMNDGPIVFKIPEDSSVGVSMITLDDSTHQVDPVGSDAGRLAMYVCSSDSYQCEQTVGYIKVDYNTNDHAYYKVLTTGGAEYTAGSTCDGTYNTIGLPSTTKGVCLGSDGKSVEYLADNSSEPENYLLDGTFNAESIFGPAPSDPYTSRVITATSNAIFYNKAFTETDYCLDETTKKLEPRISQVCDENNCEKYYSCTNGDCQNTTDTDDNSGEPSTEPSPGCNLADSNAENCYPGYYLTIKDTKTLVSSTSETAGDLYECTLTETGISLFGSISCSKITGDDIPIGYLYNMDMDMNPDVPIIECYLDTDGTTRKCIPTKPTDTSCGKSGENVATAGKMFATTYQGNEVYDLCLNGHDIADKANSSYFMEATGVLGLPAVPDKYIVVNLDYFGNIKVELKNDVKGQNIKYKFANDSMRIFTRTTEDKDEYCSGDKLKEYKYVRSVSGGSDLVNYYVYNAKNGSVIRKRGFFNKRITKQN